MMKYNTFSDYRKFNPKEELKNINFYIDIPIFSKRIEFYFKALIVQESLTKSIAVNEKINLEQLLDSSPDNIYAEEFIPLFFKLWIFIWELNSKLANLLPF